MYHKVQSKIYYSMNQPQLRSNWMFFPLYFSAHKRPQKISIVHRNMTNLWCIYAPESLVLQSVVIYEIFLVTLFFLNLLFHHDLQHKFYNAHVKCINNLLFFF